MQACQPEHTDDVRSFLQRSGPEILIICDLYNRNSNKEMNQE
jgi:hypothetical protein